MGRSDYVGEKEDRSEQKEMKRKGSHVRLRTRVTRGQIQATVDHALRVSVNYPLITQLSGLTDSSLKTFGT